MGPSPKGTLEKTFGDVLRSLRNTRGMSQETLAFEADLDRTFISMLERGQRLPSIATVLALSKPLGLTGADLVGHVEAALASSRDGHPARPAASR